MPAASRNAVTEVVETSHGPVRGIDQDHGTPAAATSHGAVWQPYDPVRDNVLLLRAPTPIESEDWGSRHHGTLWDSFADAGSADVQTA